MELNVLMNNDFGPLSYLWDLKPPAITLLQGLWGGPRYSTGMQHYVHKQTSMTYLYYGNMLGDSAGMGKVSYKAAIPFLHITCTE